jgi:hypothetical protein
MSQITIKVIDVEVGNGTTKTNKPYEFLDLTFKNLSFEGKAETKKIMPFGSKEVFNTLKTAQKGSVYTVVREKSADGFWNWIGIVEGEETIETATNQPVKQSTAATVRSSFETPDERAQKQLYIIRQSSLTNAVNTAVAGIDPAQVKGIADEYIDFVLNGNQQVVDDDVPY